MLPFRLIPEITPPIFMTSPQIISCQLESVRFLFSSSFGLLNTYYRYTTITSSWETQYTIPLLTRQMQHLANVSLTCLDTPCSPKKPTTQRIIFPQPPILSGMLLPPAPRTFSIWHDFRKRLMSYLRNDPLFPLFPSPPPSQASSSLEYQQTFPEPAPSTGLSCREAIPVFNHIRKKWSCGVCNKDFRGRWECRRHIEATGKRAKCLACGVNLKGRGDSMLRHFKKYCKGDVRNLDFKNAFIEA